MSWSALVFSAIAASSNNGINVVMLWSEAMDKGFSSPIWMTFRQAKELGGMVRKGEHGSTVVYASTFKKTEENKATGEEEEKDIPFRGFWPKPSILCTRLSAVASPRSLVDKSDSYWLAQSLITVCGSVLQGDFEHIRDLLNHEPANCW